MYLIARAESALSQEWVILAPGRWSYFASGFLRNIDAKQTYWLNAMLPIDMYTCCILFA